MARWSASKANWTPSLVNDASNFTDAGYMALQGGAATQLLYVSEIYIGGLATSQAPMSLCVAHDSTVGASSLSGGLLAALDPATANLSNQPTCFSASTTKPQRSSTLQLLQLAMNAFGGIVRWTALEPGHRIGILGQSASVGELSISALNTGTAGPVSAHMLFEPL